MLYDLVQSESEVRVFGGAVPLSAGKGKGTGTVGVRSGGRSEIEGLGVGGISELGVREIWDKEIDGCGGLGVGGRGVGGKKIGTFG